MKNEIINYIKESVSVKENMLLSDEIINNIEIVANIIIGAYINNKKVLIAGNGGSASDAQHIVTELVSKLYRDRKPLNAIALTSNISILTAVANDYSYEEVFTRQIQGYGEDGDVYLAISTSGNSKNIISSLIEAKKMNLITIGFTGKNVSMMDSLCDYIIKIPSEKTSIIQEVYMMISHIICIKIEKFFSESR